MKEAARTVMRHRDGILALPSGFTVVLKER